MIVSSSLY
jgi:hypothetical protein